MHLHPGRLPVIAALAAAGAAWAAPAAPAGGPYAPAKECGACHAAIHRAWSESTHARAATSEAYVEALRRAIESASDKAAARAACVWCHAPTTLVTGDVDLKEPISREGVTCDFCHTVAEVDMEKKGHPFVLEPGPVKRGPFQYAGPVEGHEAAYSPLHKASPLLCASCHEHKNATGVAVLATYSEWKDGPYPARGVPCQDCHMALVPGAIVKGATLPGNPRLVNLHRVVGGSARSQLARGLDLEIRDVQRSGGSATVQVTVTNDAAGHPVPGGLATKSLVLAVAVETSDGALAHRQERVYRRELKDERGRVLSSVEDLFLKAAAVGRDNRIKPRETRSERFTVPVPPGALAIVALLEYRDSTDPRGAPATIAITRERRELRGR
jgi:hypothetical protein